VELGAAEKAIIFTESKRTQEYLLSLLEKTPYGEGIVLFNGTNSDARAQAVYADWIKRHQGTDKITGSRTADTRAALVEHFTQALLGGQWWPRWLPEINGGRGYPTFVFYQPLLFFLAVPFRLLTGNPVDGLWAATAVLLGLGAIGCYRLCLAEGARVFGVFAGLLFLLTPYLAVNWLVRGDLSELAKAVRDGRFVEATGSRSKAVRRSTFVERA